MHSWVDKGGTRTSLSPLARTSASPKASARWQQLKRQVKQQAEDRRNRILESLTPQPPPKEEKAAAQPKPRIRIRFPAPKPSSLPTEKSGHPARKPQPTEPQGLSRQKKRHQRGQEQGQEQGQEHGQEQGQEHKWVSADNLLEAQANRQLTKEEFVGLQAAGKQHQVSSPRRTSAPG